MIDEKYLIVNKDTKDVSLKEVTDSKKKIYPTDKEEEALASYIINREQVMFSNVQNEGHLRRFNEAEKLYNEHLYTDKYTAGFAYMGVRDIKQKLKIPEYDIIPRKKSAEFAAQVVLTALEAELDKAKYPLIFKKNYWTASIYGEAYRVLNYHKSDIDGYNGVSIENLTPKEVLIDDRYINFTSATGKGDAVDLILKFVYSYEEFLDKFKEEMVSIGGKRYESYKNIDKVSCGSITNGEGSAKESKYVEVWYYYNRVQDRQVILAGGGRTVVRDIPLFTRIGKRKVLPAVQLSMFPIAGSNRFQGIPSLVANLNRMKNEGMRLGAEHAIEMAKTMTMINAGAEIDREALARRDPFVEVFVPQGADPNSLFMQHNLQPLGAEFYNLVTGTLNSDAVARIGSDFNTFTQETKHASTQLQRNEYTDSMTRDVMEYNESQAETDFLKMTMYLMIDGFNDDKWEEILPTKLYMEVMDDIKLLNFSSIGKYLDYNIEYTDISVRVGTIVDANKQVKRQQFQDFLQYTTPENPVNQIVAKELGKAILPDMATKIDTEYEKQKEMQEQQMMQQQLAPQAGATGSTCDKNPNRTSTNSTIGNGGQQVEDKSKGNTTQEIVQRQLNDQLKVNAKNTSGGEMMA